MAKLSYYFLVLIVFAASVEVAVRVVNAASCTQQIDIGKKCVIAPCVMKCLKLYKGQGLCTAIILKNGTHLPVCSCDYDCGI